jgi:hypothetical protein
MPGKHHLAFCLLAVLLMACAHPHYGDASSVEDQTQSQSGHCAFSFSGSVSCAEMLWEKNQTADDTGSFFLHFGTLAANANLLPQDPAQIRSVRLWMPAMGHGSSPLTVTRLNTGVYHVTGVWFSMPGEWEIQIQIQDEHGDVSESSLPVRY